MHGDHESHDAAGLTKDQRASLMSAVGDENFSAAADVISDIIATNHADNELAVAASKIDLIRTLRQIERLVSINDEKTQRLLSSKSPKDHFSAAANAIFLLREINRTVTPVLELLDHQNTAAGHVPSHAAAAE